MNFRKNRSGRGGATGPGERAYTTSRGGPGTPGAPPNRHISMTDQTVTTAQLDALLVRGSDDGFVRAGCACYTNDSEVDRLLAGVATLAG